MNHDTGNNRSKTTTNRPQPIDDLTSSYLMRDTPLEVLVTGSDKKVVEFSRLLGYPIQKVVLSLSEIQPGDQHEALMRRGEYEAVAADIAAAKAREAFTLYGGKPAFVEDTALYLDCREGFPGPLIRFDCREEGLLRLCRDAHVPVLGGKKCPRAVAIVTLAAWNGISDKPQTWSGVVEGEISPQPRGTNGFGWDSVFIPTGSDRTFAEMDDREKDAFSPRRLAVESLRCRPFLTPVR